MAASYDPPKARIGLFSAVTAVTLAFFIDGIQFFLTLIQGMTAAVSLSLVGVPFIAVGGLAFVGAWVLSALSFLGFGFYFVLSGVRFLEGKERLGKVFGLMGGLAIELLPLLNILPSITIWVLTTVYATMKEDRNRVHRYKERVRTESAPVRKPANDNRPRRRPEIPKNQNLAA